MRYQIEFFLDTTSMYKLDFIVKFAMNGTRMKCIYPSIFFVFIPTSTAYKFDCICVVVFADIESGNTPGHK